MFERLGMKIGRSAVLNNKLFFRVGYFDNLTYISSKLLKGCKLVTVVGKANNDIKNAASEFLRRSCLL